MVRHNKVIFRVLSASAKFGEILHSDIQWGV